VSAEIRPGVWVNLDECERMAREEPARLVALLPTLSSACLTYAAEYLGQAPPDIAVPPLVALLDDEVRVVREGALLGLHSTAYRAPLSEIVRARVADIAEHDVSPGVRQTAKELLEDLDETGAA
jgi:hypothetical protein